MSKITDAEANATSLDGLVNDNGLIATLRNGPKPSWQYIVDQLYLQVGYSVAGSFDDGFTYTGIRQVGIDSSDRTWIFTGGISEIPFPVSAGTIPSPPTYQEVLINDAGNIILSSGESLQSYIDNLSASEVLNNAGGSVQDYINDVSSSTISRITDAGVGLANWPQGKGVLLGNNVLFGYNHGSSHGGAGTYAMCSKTLDGTQFSEPVVIASPRASDEEATAWGMIESGGLVYATVRFRVGGDTGYIENYLYVSDASGGNWTELFQLPDVAETGLPVVLYHGGVLSSDGKLSYGYHDTSGSLGVIKIDLSDNSTEMIEILSAANNNVGGSVLQAELNFLKRQDTQQILIISRTQDNATQKPLAWVSNGDFSNISAPVETPVHVNVNPVTPILSPSFDEVFLYYSNRYNTYSGSGVDKAALFMGRLTLDDAFNLDFSNYTYKKLIDLSGGTTSTGAEAGVQHAVRKGNQIYIAVGSRDMYEDKRADVFCLTQDFSNDSLSSWALGSLKSTQSNGRAELKLNTVSRYSPRVRFDGKSVLTRNNEDNRNEIGTYNDEGIGLALYTEMNGSQTPAIYIGHYANTFAGDRGTIEVNRDVAQRITGSQFHVPDSWRLRLGSSSFTPGSSGLYYNNAIEYLEVGAFSGVGIEIKTSASKPLVISSQYDSNYSTVELKSGSNSKEARFKTDTLECDFTVRPMQSALSNLPTPSDASTHGAMAFATDALKQGETSGNGTGVPVYYDDGNWYRMSDDTIATS